MHTLLINLYISGTKILENICETIDWEKVVQQVTILRKCYKSSKPVSCSCDENGGSLLTKISTNKTSKDTESSISVSPSGTLTYGIQVENDKLTSTNVMNDENMKNELSTTQEPTTFRVSCRATGSWRKVFRHKYERVKLKKVKKIAIIDVSMLLYYVVV